MFTTVMVNFDSSWLKYSSSKNWIVSFSYQIVSFWKMRNLLTYLIWCWQKLFEMIFYFTNSFSLSYFSSLLLFSQSFFFDFSCFNFFQNFCLSLFFLNSEPSDVMKLLFGFLCLFFFNFLQIMSSLLFVSWSWHNNFILLQDFFLVNNLLFGFIINNLVNYFVHILLSWMIRMPTWR